MELCGTRYAIISDIHGNAAALKAVLAEIERLECDTICCLGDIVGYGADAAECLELVRKNCQFIVRGNHDEQIFPPRHLDMRAEAIAALDYTAANLAKADVEYLRNLPPLITPNDLFVICHGALTDNNDYILTTEASLINLTLLEELYTGKNVVFFGHTHLPMALTKNGAKTNFTNGGKIAIDPSKFYLLNPGSVGQPRDKTAAAAFITYAPEECVAEWHRVFYDVAATQKSMQMAGIPPKSWQRIAVGK